MEHFTQIMMVLGITNGLLLGILLQLHRMHRYYKQSIEDRTSSTIERLLTSMHAKLSYIKDEIHKASTYYDKPRGTPHSKTYRNE